MNDDSLDIQHISRVKNNFYLCLYPASPWKLAFCYDERTSLLLTWHRHLHSFSRRRVRELNAAEIII